MKISISIATVILILSSCATKNYGKLKYSNVEMKNNNDLASRQLPSTKIITEDDQKIIVIRDISTSSDEKLDIIEVESKSTKVVKEEQQKSFTSLRNKMNNAKNEIFLESELIQELKSDLEPEKTPKENNKFAKVAVLMGGLSFIPVVGWIFSILAMVMGGIAIKLYKKYPNKYEGTATKAIVGIVLGVVSLIIGSIIVLLTLIL